MPYFRIIQNNRKSDRPRPMANAGAPRVSLTGGRADESTGVRPLDRTLRPVGFIYASQLEMGRLQGPRDFIL